MRIITGTARGKKLSALEGRDVRPTTDRVKEALFDILQFRIEDRRFLDMFAGSGQIGLEALSRGAKSAVMIDASKESIRVIEQNTNQTQLEHQAKILCADALAYVSSTAEVFDIAFLDPPYHADLLIPALEKVVRCIAESGVIICEHLKETQLPDQVGDFIKEKTYRYGKIHLTRYERP
ncbi:16S rRNA (guanine(966)-N(2))-methyltransferase RsmD [Scatolibacter rhodanostii]|uniref:16S rRNA (guanine(966)-N(2))-methyltransferase RsmD n=1 Tax=Scatolibacter rhodanostii TaxID=2014781 RepID=UPI000C0796AF|nr:16S rRNA (guanine(966)-N(2))-methyltransferase RsmD [Scatolibacter rhodanostii]